MNGLKIMKGADGSPRPTWYWQGTRQGKKVRINLKIQIRGTIPTDDQGRWNVDGMGDQAFRDSRHAALTELQRMRRDAGKTAAVDREKRIYRMQSGKAVKDTRLDELPALWRSIKRAYTPTPERMAIYDATFRRFADFAAAYCAEHGGTCDTLNTVTPEIAGAWFDRLRSDYAWETVKGQMSLLSGAFKRWATSGDPNPFLGVVTRHGAGETKIQRKPLTEAEIARVLDCARGDTFYYPLIVCGVSTGLRLKDICNLRWADVDLRGGLVTVTTAKTGVTVTIPVFAEFRRVLEARHAECADDEPFVFPDAQRKYAKTSERSTLVRGVKPYLAKAVYGDRPEAEDAQLVGSETPAPTVAETLALIEQSRFAPSKKERVADTYRRFAAGDSYAAITAATGRHKGQITQDLQCVEDLTGRRIRPGDRYARSRKTVSTSRALVNLTRQARAVGKHAGCVYGWHSFRTAFVVMAIENGVPVADVQDIVGHTTEEMTMNYYRPTKKHTAERVKKQMKRAGTVLDGRGRISETIEAEAHAALPAPKPTPDAVAIPQTSGDAARRLAIARAVLTQGETATVAAVLAAAGVDAAADPERALAIVGATVTPETKARVAAVLHAAGI